MCTNITKLKESNQNEIKNMNIKCCKYNLMSLVDYLIILNRFFGPYLY